VIGSAGIIPIHDPQLKDNYAAAGVNLSVPIFDGMLFSARAEEARLKAKASEASLRDEENNVIRDVRVTALNLDYAGERVTLTAELLESATEAYDLAQTRYKVGSSSIVELS
jgi:outer membrane protein